MYAPPASTAAEPPYTTGHLSPPSVKPEHTRPVTSDSESALSEALDDPAVLASAAKIEPRENSDNGDHFDTDDESSPEKDAMGSDDPDFDME